MTIGLEAERANLANPTGVEVYAVQLIKHLAKLDQKNQYFLYFRTKPQQWFYELPENFTIKVIPFPKFWTQIRLSWEMFWHPVDVLMILASALPLYHPKNSVVTVHDIAFEFYPKAFTWFNRTYLKFFSRYVVKYARKIITVSEASKKDLIRVYHGQPEKIHAIHLGFSDIYKPQSYEQTQLVLDKYGLSYKKYILFVGTFQPRKNIKELIESYDLLKKDNHIEEKLVLVGGKGWLWKPILERIEKSPYKDSIKVMDYVAVEDLPALYSGAILETLPALYEGFGLPPLEAMACGTPVVVSNISSLPEVVGYAGVLVDPVRSSSIAEGLLKVLTDPELRNEMSKKGIEQARNFAWESTARKTLDLINTLEK